MQDVAVHAVERCSEQQTSRSNGGHRSQVVSASRWRQLGSWHLPFSDSSEGVKGPLLLCGSMNPYIAHEVLCALVAFVYPRPLSSERKRKAGEGDSKGRWRNRYAHECTSPAPPRPPPLANHLASPSLQFLLSSSGRGRCGGFSELPI